MFQICCPVSDTLPDVKINKNRMSSYSQWQDELCFDGMQFPSTIAEISKFERKNPTLAINVFKWMGKRTDENGDTLSTLSYLRQCSGNKG